MYIVNRDWLIVGGSLTDGGNLVEWHRNTFNSSNSNTNYNNIYNNPNKDPINSSKNTANPAIPVVLPFWSPSGERSTGIYRVYIRYMGRL